MVPLTSARGRPGPLLVGLALAVGALAPACLPGDEERSARRVEVAPADTDPAALPWRDCGGGVQCATLTVPVDHDDPDGSTVDLAVARRPAAARDRRVGSLVVNPGGPGGSGVDLVRAGSLAGGVATRFDLVSWDPRGVGASRPLACAEELPAYRALDWTPDDDAEQARLDATARELAEGCRRAAGDLVDHLATRDSARDLDALRAALGEEQLTFLGFSYGTSLGLVYRDLFPDRVRALVLDGVADPREDLQGFLGAQARALEAEVAGALGPAVADYDRLAADAEAGRGPVDSTTLAYAAIAASYAPGGAASLREAVAAGRRGEGRALQALADGYFAAAEFGVYAAVTCSDQAHPDGPRAFDAVAEALAAQAPRFGEIMANELRVCAWWPPTAPVPGLGGPAGGTPVLVVGNTGDVATPYATAVRVAEALGPAGVLLTQEGTGHTSLGRSTCVDDHVRRYLEDLSAPPAGTRCR